MGSPLSLSERLPDNIEELSVLNLGAGSCSSDISRQVVQLKFKHLTNVEIWPAAFIKLQSLKFATDTVENIMSDAYAYVMHQEEPCDVVLLIDVLEHFVLNDAIALLDKCRKISKRVVIFLPIGECRQDALDGNPYQKHASTWTLDDFEGASVEYLPKFHKHFAPPVDAAWVIYEDN